MALLLSRYSKEVKGREVCGNCRAEGGGREEQIEIMNLAMASPGTELMVKMSQRLQEFAI
jgi:hypothetical protein